jgi:hypothetical protein
VNFVSDDASLLNPRKSGSHSAYFVFVRHPDKCILLDFPTLFIQSGLTFFFLLLVNELSVMYTLLSMSKFCWGYLVGCKLTSSRSLSITNFELISFRATAIWMNSSRANLEESSLIPVFLNALYLPSLWVSSQIFPTSEPPFLVVYIAVPITCILIPTVIGSGVRLYRMCCGCRSNVSQTSDQKRANYERKTHKRDASNPTNSIESHQYHQLNQFNVEKLAPLELQDIETTSPSGTCTSLSLAVHLFFVTYSLVAFQNLMHIRCVHFGTKSESPTEILDRTYKTLLFTGLPAVLYICVIAKYKLTLTLHLNILTLIAVVASVVISLPEFILQWLPLFPFSLSFTTFQVIPSVLLFHCQNSSKQRLDSLALMKLLVARQLGFEFALLTPYLMPILGGFTPFMLILSTLTFATLQVTILKRVSL